MAVRAKSASVRAVGVVVGAILWASSKHEQALLISARLNRLRKCEMGVWDRDSR